MAFSANVASDQNARFVTFDRHQRAGHVSNLGFQIDQARPAQAVIYGQEELFQRRLSRLKRRKTT